MTDHLPVDEKYNVQSHLYVRACCFAYVLRLDMVVTKVQKKQSEGTSLKLSSVGARTR